MLISVTSFLSHYPFFEACISFCLFFDTGELFAGLKLLYLFINYSNTGLLLLCFVVKGRDERIHSRTLEYEDMPSIRGKSWLCPNSIDPLTVLTEKMFRLDNKKVENKSWGKKRLYTIVNALFISHNFLELECHAFFSNVL